MDKDIFLIWLIAFIRTNNFTLTREQVVALYNEATNIASKYVEDNLL